MYVKHHILYDSTQYIHKNKNYDIDRKSLDLTNDSDDKNGNLV